MAGALRMPRGSAPQCAEESLVGSGSLRVIEACRGLGGKRSDIAGVYVFSKALLRFVFRSAPTLDPFRLVFSCS